MNFSKTTTQFWLFLAVVCLLVTTFSGNIGYRRIVLGLDGNAVVVVMEEADVDKTSRFVGQALIKIGAALHSGEINTRF